MNNNENIGGNNRVYDFNYRNIKLKHKKRVDIANVIKERLNLPTIQRKLYNDFGLINTCYSYLTNPIFLSNIMTKWDENRKNEFLILLGGPVNKNLTVSFVDNLIKPKETSNKKIK